METETALPGDGLRQAAILFGRYTDGFCYFWMLQGPRMASARAEIMSALKGCKVPQSKSGINALRDALFEALEIEGECLAARQDNFTALIRQLREEKG